MLDFLGGRGEGGVLGVDGYISGGIYSVQSILLPCK